MIEREMGDLISAFPKDFFPRKDLLFKDREGSLCGVGRYDLLFEDEHGTIVVMELKARTAKLEDADQLGKYRDALQQRMEQHIWMWLVAPLIPKNVRDFLDSLGIQYTEIHEAEYRDVARRHDVVFGARAERRRAITDKPSSSQRDKFGAQILDRDSHRRGTNVPHQGNVPHIDTEVQAGKTGDATDDGTVLPDTAPLTLGKAWLQQAHMKDGLRLLHYLNGDYYRHGGVVYRKLDQKEIRGQWYEFFTDRNVRVAAPDGSVKIVKLKPDRKFCADLHDAISSYCNIRIEDGVHEPFLIRARAPMDLARAVVFRNGILYVTDDRLSAITPDVFLTSTLPYDYNPRYQCLKWLWFVNDIFNGDKECIALLQEWFGYCLIASNHMQAMMFFFGVPGSGKSTTASVLQALLGPARCCGATTDNFKGLFGAAKLENKYLAIMSESRDTSRSDIDKLLQMWKAITGGDLIDIRGLYKPHRDARLFCRLTYVANEAIPFDDASQALAARMNLLWFPNNYRKKCPDRMLDFKLREELPGIALWAIEGLKRRLANDRFTVPTASKIHLAQMAELTNPIGVMLEECTARHIGSDFMKHRVDSDMLYDLWCRWCDATRIKTNLTRISFGMKLAHMDKPVVKKRIMETGERKYVYQGLEIRPEAKAKYLM